MYSAMGVPAHSSFILPIFVFCLIHHEVGGL